MKQLLFLIFITTLSLSACKDEPKEYNKQKESIEDYEKRKPIQFLSIENLKTKKNLVGEWVIKGEIKNKATVAKYKDIELQIDCYSKTQTLLGTEYTTIFETIEPNNSAEFKYKTFGFKGTDSIKLTMKNANNE